MIATAPNLVAARASAEALGGAIEQRVGQEKPERGGPSVEGELLFLSYVSSFRYSNFIQF